MAYHLIARLPASVEVDDLIQVGMIGLDEAISRCDPREGPLERFAMPRIRGAMIDELREAGWASRRCHRNRRLFEDAAQRLQNRWCRQPTDAEMAAELGLSLAAYQSELAQVHRSRLVPLDDVTGSQDDDDDEDLHTPAFGDPGADPLSQLEGQRLRWALAQAIRELPPREQSVMLMRYEHDMMFKDIGRELGVSESRVSQMHRHAVEMLRAQLQAH